MASVLLSYALPVSPLSRRTLWIASLALASSAPSLAQSPPRLNGTLAIAPPNAANPRQITVQVTLSNPGAQPVVLPAQVVSTAQLLLEIRDTRNQVLSMPPPPTPETATVTIAPGQSVSRTITVPTLSPPMRAGRYSLRFRSPMIVGAPVTLTIAR